MNGRIALNLSSFNETQCIIFKNQIENNNNKEWKEITKLLMSMDTIKGTLTA